MNLSLSSCCLVLVSLASALFCRILVNGCEFALYYTTNDVPRNRHDAAINIMFRGWEPLECVEKNLKENRGESVSPPFLRFGKLWGAAGAMRELGSERLIQ